MRAHPLSKVYERDGFETGTFFRPEHGGSVFPAERSIPAPKEEERMAEERLDLLANRVLRWVGRVQRSSCLSHDVVVQVDALGGGFRVSQDADIKR